MTAAVVAVVADFADDDGRGEDSKAPAPDDRPEYARRLTRWCTHRGRATIPARVARCMAGRASERAIRRQKTKPADTIRSSHKLEQGGDHRRCSSSAEETRLQQQIRVSDNATRKRNPLHLFFGRKTDCRALTTDGGTKCAGRGLPATTGLEFLAGEGDPAKDLARGE